MGDGFRNYLSMLQTRSQLMAQMHQQQMAQRQQMFAQVGQLAEGFMAREAEKKKYRYMAEKTEAFDPNEPLTNSQIENRLTEKENKLQTEINVIEGEWPDMGVPESQPQSVAGRIAVLRAKQDNIRESREDPKFERDLINERWREFYKSQRLNSPEYYETAEKYGEMMGDNVLGFGEKEAIKTEEQRKRNENNAAIKKKNNEEEKPKDVSLALIKDIEKKRKELDDVPGALESVLSKLMDEYRGLINDDRDNAQSIYNNFLTRWNAIINEPRGLRKLFGGSNKEEQKQEDLKALESTRE